MNKEIRYVGQGALLVLVVIIGLGFVQLLADIEEAGPMAEEQGCGTIGLAKVTIKHTEESKAGQVLFDNNCATCHKVNKNLTGPALMGIEDRVKDRQLLYRWIRNNAAVLQSGNRYFNDLYKTWNQTPMNNFPSLTDKEIDQILAYIKVYQPAVAP